MKHIKRINESTSLEDKCENDFKEAHTKGSIVTGKQYQVNIIYMMITIYTMIQFLNLDHMTQETGMDMN